MPHGIYTFQAGGKYDPNAPRDPSPILWPCALRLWTTRVLPAPPSEMSRRQLRYVYIYIMRSLARYVHYNDGRGSGCTRCCIHFTSKCTKKSTLSPRTDGGVYSSYTLRGGRYNNVSCMSWAMSTRRVNVATKCTCLAHHDSGMYPIGIGSVH